MRRHPLIAFVVLTYALTWALTIPFVYSWRVVLEREFSPWLLLFLPAPFGPTFAALLLTWRLEGRDGLRRLLGWRGWFLPRLQSCMGPLRASLIIGAVWTFWHTPMFWFPGAAIPSFLELSTTAVLLYLIQITGEAQDLSIYLWTLGLTWVAAAVALALPRVEPVSDPLPVEAVS